MGCIVPLCPWGTAECQHSAGGSVLWVCEVHGCAMARLSKLSSRRHKRHQKVAGVHICMCTWMWVCVGAQARAQVCGLYVCVCVCVWALEHVGIGGSRKRWASGIGEMLLLWPFGAQLVWISVPLASALGGVLMCSNVESPVASLLRDLGQGGALCVCACLCVCVHVYLAGESALVKRYTIRLCAGGRGAAPNTICPPQRGRPSTHACRGVASKMRDATRCWNARDGPARARPVPNATRLLRSLPPQQQPPYQCACTLRVCEWHAPHFLDGRASCYVQGLHMKHRLEPVAA